MEGARFDHVTLRRPDLRYPFPTRFASRLRGQTVRAVSRRAKYLLVELSSGDILQMHLGMSGSFRVVGDDATDGARPRSAYYHARHELERHDHVVFRMSSGRTVIFNDPRRFGFMRILDHDPAAAAWTEGVVGPEPLDRAFTATTLARALAGKKTTLKAALLDQRVVAGLGNIYVCEALHGARLSPRRKAGTIVDRRGGPTPRLVALVTAIKATLRTAIAHGHRVAGPDRFRVYDHEGQPCPRRDCSGTIARIVQGGRSTFYCPVCQR